RSRASLTQDGTPHGCFARTRTSLGAPLPLDSGERSKVQTPGANIRRGNEEVCVLEIVRPGMEDSESEKKQENTGIGPASACRGESAFTRYGTPNGCSAAPRTSLGAPPTPRFGVSEAKVQNPGHRTRRGNE